MYTAISLLIKLLLLGGAAAYAAFFVVRKERIFRPKSRPKPEAGLALESEAKAEVDEEFISGQDCKLANLLTVLCLGTYRFYAVPQGFKRVVTLFGKFEQVSEPGLHGCWSFWNFYHVPSAPILVKEQVIEYPEQTVYTKDGNECNVKMAVYVTIHDIQKVVFSVADHWAAIKNLVDSILRNECGDLPARELLASRKKLADRLRSQLDSGAAPWGIHVRLVEITNIWLKPRGKS
jgi:regulator of protease activity HflC (stomatin/prohibitin superfamily)